MKMALPLFAFNNSETFGYVSITKKGQQNIKLLQSLTYSRLNHMCSVDFNIFITQIPLPISEIEYIGTSNNFISKLCLWY